MVKLADTSNYTSFLNLFSDKNESRNEFLKEGTQIAKRYGYDALAIDRKTNKAVLIKGNKVYR